MTFETFMLSLVALAYYFLPAYVANGAPPILAHLPGLRKWNCPIDFGRSFRGKRLLGSHKTWRGLLLGTLLATIIFLFQQWLAVSGRFTPSFIPYAALPWWTGILMGIGALLVGDAVESFLKRQIGIKPGKPWIPFDQADYTLGVFLVTAWLFWPGWLLFLVLLLFNTLAHFFFHYLGFLLGLSKDKF